jgi:DNA-binding transcriptional ArsR family regulator
MATLRSAATAAHPDQPADEQVDAAVLAFTLLADATRVRMLWAMRDEEQDVTSLAAAAGCRLSVASQHLSKLRLSGLVRSRRSGRNILYRVKGGHLRTLLAEALFHADHQVSGTPVHD